MGGLLAMTGVVVLTRPVAVIWPALLACLILAGCGASPQVTRQVMAGFSPAITAAPVKIDAKAPMMDVAVPAQNVAGPMARIARRGDVSEWRSADGVGMTLRGSQIIATRGFGPDLMIADAQDANRALRHGHGTFSRSMHWLDGENHDWSEVFACTLMAAPVQPTPSELTLTETCVSPKIQFTNTYAVSPKTRALIRTDQWVSPGLGQIKLEPR